MRTFYMIVLSLALLVMGGGASAQRGAGLSGVVYLAPADQIINNLFLTELETGQVYQLTTEGVENFTVSSNQIVYTRPGSGSSDLWLLNLDTRTTRQLTNCAEVGASCTHPVWRPGTTQVVYLRQEANAEQSWLWILDLTDLSTRVVFEEPVVDPVWSPDGSRIAVYEPAQAHIRIHEFDTSTDQMIVDNIEAFSGRFSPDSTRLIYPMLVRGAIGTQFYTHLMMLDLRDGAQTSVSGPEDAAVDDGAVSWSPDGTKLVIARRYLDERYTLGRQLYVLDVAAGDVTPLVVDANYNHAAMQWDAAGQRIVFQRFSLTVQEARPEIWMVDLESDEVTLVAENGYLPQWMP